jgi:hypothetical protein
MPAGVQRTVLYCTTALHIPFVCTREDLRMRTDGVRTSSVNAVDEAEADVNAMRQLTREEVCRAWVVTGYFGPAEMSKHSGLAEEYFREKFSRKRKMQAC